MDRVSVGVSASGGASDGSSPAGALLCQAARRAALLAALVGEETGIVRQMLACSLHHIDQALPVPTHHGLCAA